MSDDLVKRLKTPWDTDSSIISQTDKWMRERKEAASRIKELEAELHLMKTSGIVEVAVRNPSIMEYMKHWEGRAETAEAKLAKAVEALRKIEGWPDYRSPSHQDIARATLAEIEGEK